MRRTEQILLATMVFAGVLVGFWLLVLSPKRDEASKLDEQVSQLRTSLNEARQQVAAGEQARQEFGTDYRRLVVLGKAVPADDEQASLLIQLQNLAARSGVEFQGIDLSSSSSSTTPPPAPTDTSTTSDSSTSSDASSSTDTSASTTSLSTTTSTTVAPATEAAASTLPIGATIGSAGLPVMSYDMTFTGQFFQIAEFMRRVDGLVHSHGAMTDVHGRLLTVNGFDLQPADDYGSLTNPVLNAHLNVTTYVTPADQGLTGGATPSGPSSSTPTLTSTSETSTAPPTASETPTSTTP